MKKTDFTFFHGYDELLWRGYEKRGLLDSFTGLRFCQNKLLPEHKKFNNLAARDNELFKLIHNNGLPWYIDRLQGGCYIEEYPYDMRLIDEIGGEFFGFQLHEWVSNMRSDYNKLKALSPSEMTKEGIEKEIFRLFPFKNLFLEAASAKEYSDEFPYPEFFEDLVANAERLYKKRSAYTKSRLIACDSVMTAYNVEFRLGAQRVMAEIGAQTPYANIQLAYARGMAKAYGKSFGAYYEPWGGEPFSVCAYQQNAENEWNIRSDGDFPFQICGSEGGSSRSLQRRLYLYSYLAGASFISEEWGAYNTFIDTVDFELSKYGEVKREFLSFVNKYPAGEFYAPIAVVLPEDMSILENEVCRDWFGDMSYRNCDLSLRDKKISDSLCELMCDSSAQYGNETKILPNSELPDAFDIIHEDCESAFSNYKYLVDLTNNPAFSKRHNNTITVSEAKQLIISLMPCTVTGGVHWFVNRASDCIYLAVFNNDGIDKSAVNGERQIDNAARVAKISVKYGAKLTPLSVSAEIAYENGKYCTELKAGDIFTAKIQ